jgi:hypothetical protein
MRVREAIKIMRLYQKIADAFYAMQINAGAKFTRGRLKFRRDVKEAIDCLISKAEAK